MTTIKAEYYRLNGAEWDKYYFKTTADMVEGLNTELSQVYGGKNLARPDLEGKQYLGNGWYRYNTTGGIIKDYNVFSGYIRLNGTNTGLNLNLYLYSNPLPNNVKVSFTYEYVLGTINFGSRYLALFPNENNIPTDIGLMNGTEYRKKILFENYLTYNNNEMPRIYLGPGHSTFIDFTFKIQLEKGSVSTPYTLPAPFVLPHEAASKDWVTSNTRSSGWTPSWSQVSSKPTNIIRQVGFSGGTMTIEVI